MRNINLLPRVPWIQRFFFPVILAILLASGTAVVMIYHYSSKIVTKITLVEGDTTSVQSIIDRQLELTGIDSITAQYNVLAKEIDQLRAKQPDWKEMIEQIQAALPEGSRIGQMSTDGTMIRATYEFSDKVSLAHYMDKLTTKPFVQQIQLSSIQRIQRESTSTQESDVYFQVVISLTIQG